MSTTADHPKKITWYITVAAVLFIFVLVGAYSARIAHETTGYDDDQAQTRLATLNKMHAADTKTLTTADWIDQDKGIVRIPIDEAMTQEVAVLAAKPLAMGAALPSAAAPSAPAAAAAAPTATNAAPPGTNAAPTTPPPTK